MLSILHAGLHIHTSTLTHLNDPVFLNCFLNDCWKVLLKKEAVLTSIQKLKADAEFMHAEL